MSCGQVKHTTYTLVLFIYNHASQNFALLYLNYYADFYEVYILYALIRNFKETVPTVCKMFVLKSRLIFFVFFLLCTKPEIILSHAKTFFSCFHFLKIWYTYRAVKDPQIQWFWWNSKPIWKSYLRTYMHFLLNFFQNLVSCLLKRTINAMALKFLSYTSTLAIKSGSFWRIC